MPPLPDDSRWPELPYAAWQDTYATLHLWTQIVGKIRLAQTPWLNHSWHVPLYVNARGLTTSPIPYEGRAFQIDFDFIDHVLWVRTSDGHVRQLMLAPKSVAEFYADLFVVLGELGLQLHINTTPCEIADGVPFDQDLTHASYDRDPRLGKRDGGDFCRSPHQQGCEPGPVLGAMDFGIADYS